MSYCTVADITTGAEALQELAQPLGVEESLMRATIDGADRSTWSAVEVIAADRALITALEMIERADAEIDARLAQRGYAVPLSSAQFPVLRVWAVAITRYLLARVQEPDTTKGSRTARDYRDAIASLDLIAAGKLSLGANDPLAAGQQSATIEITGNPRLMSRQSLRHL